MAASIANVYFNGGCIAASVDKEIRLRRVDRRICPTCRLPGIDGIAVPDICRRAYNCCAGVCRSGLRDIRSAVEVDVQRPWLRGGAIDHCGVYRIGNCLHSRVARMSRRAGIVDNSIEIHKESFAGIGGAGLLLDDIDVRLYTQN